MLKILWKILLLKSCNWVRKKWESKGGSSFLQRKKNPKTFSVALLECSSRIYLHSKEMMCLCDAGECKELKVL